MTNDFKIKEWEESYSRNENHIYYPKEEVVKFLNRFVTKRLATGKFQKILNTNQTSKLNALDLGCGIGRQTILFEEFDLNGYGLDISQNAINEAISLSQLSGFEMRDRFATISTPTLPFENDFFSVAICDSVLDSMEFTIAKQYISELDRVVSKYLFITLIGNNSKIDDDSESIVDSDHEHGTIQSFYTLEKINELIQNSQWKINWLNHVIENRFDIENQNFSTFNSRYHIVLSK